MFYIKCNSSLFLKKEPYKIIGALLYLLISLTQKLNLKTVVKYFNNAPSQTWSKRIYYDKEYQTRSSHLSIVSN